MLYLWRGYFKIKHQQAQGTHRQVKLMLWAPAQTVQCSSHPQCLVFQLEHVAALHPRHSCCQQEGGGMEPTCSSLCPSLLFLAFFFPPRAEGNTAAPTRLWVMSLHHDQQAGRVSWMQCELSGPTCSCPAEHSAAHQGAQHCSL